MRQIKVGRRAVCLGLAAGAMAALVACAAPGESETAPQTSTSRSVTEAEIAAALTKKSTLTLWTWSADMDAAIKAFKAAYPNVTIKLENPAGANMNMGPALKGAIEGGMKVPDVVLFDNDAAGFVLTNDLLDLTQFGATELKDDYLPAAWKKAAFANGVWGLPNDVGPVALIYRPDLFKAAGITEPPATWEEFAADAKAIHEATGNYIMNFSTYEMRYAAVQAGGSPLFEWNGGKEIKVGIARADTKRVAAFWQKLLDAHLVSTDPVPTDTWYKGMNSGKYAAWMAPAWGPPFLEGTAAHTAGRWRATDIPQWDTQRPVDIDSGGALFSIPKASNNPLVAYAFIRWLTHDPEQAHIYYDRGVFPATFAATKNNEWLSSPSKFFGGQEINRVYSDIGSRAITSPPNPLAIFNESILSSDMNAVLAHRTDLWQGYQAWHVKIVKYAKQQGVTVTLQE
jgi:multiple sugar transport system substrate-binding protein